MAGGHANGSEKEAEPFVGDQFCLINGVRVPQSLYHSPIEKARGSNVGFPPASEVTLMSAFDPKRTLCEGSDAQRRGG